MVLNVLTWRRAASPVRGALGCPLPVNMSFSETVHFKGTVHPKNVNSVITHKPDRDCALTFKSIQHQRCEMEKRFALNNGLLHLKYIFIHVFGSVPHTKLPRTWNIVHITDQF